MINYGRKIVADEAVAEKIGMLKAQILAQVDYWADKTNNIKNGYKWVYNSMIDWHEQFNWVSLSTLKRAFSELESQGLLVTSSFNKFKYDRTKWYRVDYELLDKLMLGDDNAKIVAIYPNVKPESTHKPLGQNEPMDNSKLNQSHRVKMNQPIPKDYQEITHKINNNNSNQSQSVKSATTNQPTKSNQRYYEQFKKNQLTKPHSNYYGYNRKKHVEVGTDWSKVKAEPAPTGVTGDSLHNFFAELEAKTFGRQAQEA